MSVFRLRNVSCSLRNVSLELRNLSFRLRNVSLIQVPAGADEALSAGDRDHPADSQHGGGAAGDGAAELAGV